MKDLPKGLTYFVRTESLAVPAQPRTHYAVKSVSPAGLAGAINPSQKL